jgi:hypothetical protein
MPLDKVKARSDVQGARNAYFRGPHADFIQRLATHIEEALASHDEMALGLNRAQNDNSRMARELDDEKTAYRKLREQMIHTEAMVAVLREIKASPKGAQKKAAEMLATMGVKDEAAKPAAAVPAKIEVP